MTIMMETVKYTIFLCICNYDNDIYDFVTMVFVFVLSCQQKTVCVLTTDDSSLMQMLFFPVPAMKHTSPQGPIILSLASRKVASV